MDSLGKGSTTDDNDVQQKKMLGDLLSSLAVGVRSVSSLPTTHDDLEYTKSILPESYTKQLKETQDELTNLLKEMIDENTDDVDSDVQLMELCADACDAWTEQAEAYLSNTSHETLVRKVQHVATKSRQHASTKFSLLMDGLVDMPKPQATYGIRMNNSRDTIFIPRVHPEKPFSIVPLNLSIKNGRPMDNKYGGSPNEFYKVPSSKVGPTNKHVPHPYRTEIEQLQYQEWMTKSSSKPPPRIIKDGESELQGIWIDTPEQLHQLSKKLQTNVDRIAIDLEAHGYRSFAGMVCLMQITIHEKNNDDSTTTTVGNKKKQVDYLIDTLKLWNHMNSAFASVFANPSIVKIFHGADCDVQWLQRDFGLYVVNLFDTGRAARCLKLPSYGFAYLLSKYVEGATTDKTFQLSDWRQRPLPPKMRTYAVMDTHYLLDIYEHLKHDLENHSSKEVSISQALDASKLVSLIRYDKDLFDIEGYKTIISSKKSSRNNKKRTDLTSSSKEILKALWNWRDLLARSEDESHQAICSNKQLLQLAMTRPTTLSSLQTTLNPLPPMILQKSSEILQIIMNATTSTEQQQDSSSSTVRQAPSSAFFKPATTNTTTSSVVAGVVVPNDDDDNNEDNETGGRNATTRGPGITSPVMGTDALYKEAGWTMLSSNAPTTENVAIVGTSEEEDGSNTMIQVDPANQSTAVAAPTSHSLKMNKGFESGASTNKTTTTTTSLQKVVQIRTTMQEKDMLGLISPTALDDARATTAEQQQQKPSSTTTTGSGKKKQQHQESEEEDEDFVIPKSMREIYKISNHNRRNKKVPSPVHHMVAGASANNPIVHNPMKVDTIEGANQVLEGYFDSGDGGTALSSLDNSGASSSDGSKKRQKVSTETGSFLAEIGWVKDKEEAEAMKTKERANSDDLSQSWKSSSGGGASSSAATTITNDEGNTNNNNTETTSDGGGGATQQQQDGKQQQPFDYSNVPSSMGIHNPSQQSNPFFASSSSTPGRRSSSENNSNNTTSSRGSGKGRKGRPGSSGSNNNNSGNTGSGGGGGTRGSGVRERPSSKPDGRSHAYKGKR